MAGFFANFGTGFLSAGGDILAERRKAEMERDENRRKALDQIDVQSQIYASKAKIDAEEKRAASERMIAELTGRAGNQMNAAVAASAQKDSQRQAVMPADMAAETLPEEVDDETVSLPKVQIEELPAPSVEPTPEQLNDTAPSGVDLRKGSASVYNPDQLAYLQQVAATGDEQAFTQAKLKFMEENAAPEREVNKKNAQLTAIMNEQDPIRRSILADMYGVDLNKLTAKAGVDKETYAASLAESKLPTDVQPYIPSGKPAEKLLESWDKSKITGKEATEAAQAATQALAAAKQFNLLSENVTTGGPLFSIGAINDMRGAFSPSIQAIKALNLDQMFAKIKDLKPASDTDTKLAMQAGPSAEKSPEANALITAIAITKAQNVLDFQDFAQEARAKDWHPKDITRKWNEYLEENSMFTKDSTLGNIKQNTERLTWRDYFDAKNNNTLEEARAQAKSIYNPDPGTPGKPNAQTGASTIPFTVDPKTGVKKYDLSRF